MRRFFWAILLGAGCGYAPVGSLPHAAGKLSVVAGASTVADPEVVAGALFGARRELAAQNALGEDARAYPRLVVEVLRLDDDATAIGVGPQPIAGSVHRRATGRAHVEDRPGNAGFDTGDLTVDDDAAPSPDALSDLARTADARRDLGRRLGEALAARVVGAPSPGM